MHILSFWSLFIQYYAHKSRADSIELFFLLVYWTAEDTCVYCVMLRFKVQLAVDHWMTPRYLKIIFENKNKMQ